MAGYTRSRSVRTSEFYGPLGSRRYRYERVCYDLAARSNAAISNLVICIMASMALG
jgi:hypothetical protein